MRGEGPIAETSRAKPQPSCWSRAKLRIGEGHAVGNDSKLTTDPNVSRRTTCRREEVLTLAQLVTTAAQLGKAATAGQTRGNYEESYQ